MDIVKKQNPIQRLGVMIDCSRNSVMNLKSLKKLITLLAAAGYNTLQLYTEDTFELNNEPYFGYMRGRYSKTELKEIDAYAISQGIELIPCIQTLAHLNAIFRWPEYKVINDTGDILLVGEERTYKLIENIFDTLAECFTSRNVNIGMDEAHGLGQGAYKKKYGHHKPADIMLKHLKKVNEIANSRGFTCSMWSDMFYYMVFGGKNYSTDNLTIPDEIKNNIPRNIKLIYWDYYTTDKVVYENNIRSHQKLSDDIIFAGGAWSWVGMIPLNYYAINASKAAMSACIDNGIKDVFITIWGDNGGFCSPFSVLPALICVAEYRKDNFNIKKIKERFKEIVGMDYDTFIDIDLPNFLTENQDKNIRYNPSKYLFYSDVLTGIYDSTIKEGCGEIYKRHSARLKKGESNQEYGFIFKTVLLLCECLYYKADLGIVTRRLYKARDKKGLNILIEKRYKPLIKKIGQFYDSLTEYWNKLYKSYGSEIMDIRIGGLIQRLKSVVKRLTEFIYGRAESIQELDETLLDLEGGGENLSGQPLLDNSWSNIVTVNTI